MLSVKRACLLNVTSITTSSWSLIKIDRKLRSCLLYFITSVLMLSYMLYNYYLEWSVVAERFSALDSSSCVVKMWVRISAWPVAVLVSLSKTLNHNCFVLWMGRKAVGPVCCVMHVKEPRTLIVKEKGLAPVFLDLRLEHPAGWMCACYKLSVLYCIVSIPANLGYKSARHIVCSFLCKCNICHNGIAHMYICIHVLTLYNVHCTLYKICYYFSLAKCFRFLGICQVYH